MLVWVRPPTQGIPQKSREKKNTPICRREKIIRGLAWVFRLRSEAGKVEEKEMSVRERLGRDYLREALRLETAGDLRAAQNWYKKAFYTWPALEKTV